MKVILLVFFLIPIFIFQAFIIVDSINTIKMPANNSPAGLGKIQLNNERVSRKTNLRVVK